MCRTIGPGTEVGDGETKNTVSTRAPKRKTPFRHARRNGKYRFETRAETEDRAETAFFLGNLWAGL
ncbi:MAG: hypothetical protein GY820_00425 [Gammaproteobacteria bacterium]|nr:hypothetical protein [Gammaproteobacteria bacterium]